MTDQTARVADYTYVLNCNLRILVVDDDPIQREFASVYLATPSVEVVTARGGSEALAKLEKESFDIALIDFDMPGMNGVELITLLRAIPRFAALPVIMVTGFEDIMTIDSAFHAGATTFVTKPVNWRLLSYQIRFVLKHLKTPVAA